MSLPELRLQLAAVALSEELNFTRAAERLRITQPALSKQIGELEKRIGFSVFRRVPRGVELTEAGQVFIRGCKDSLGLLEKSIRLAKSSHDQIDPLIAVGHSPYVDPHPHLVAPRSPSTAVSDHAITYRKHVRC